MFVGFAFLLAVVCFIFKRPYDRLWYFVNKATCPTRLKDIGMAMRLYARDSNDMLPPVLSSTEKVGWAGALQPYIKSSMTGPFVGSWVYECPYDATGRSNFPAQPGFTDYWYNANVMQKTARGVTPVRLAQIQTPSQTVMVGCGGSSQSGTGFDATYNQCGDGTSLIASVQTCASTANRPLIFPNRPIHYSPEFGANLLFADGHVTYFHGKSTKQSQALDIRFHMP
jgi:prepilin-type processing-associated H-X9-DG protein